GADRVSAWSPWAPSALARARTRGSCAAPRRRARARRRPSPHSTGGPLLPWRALAREAGRFAPPRNVVIAAAQVPFQRGGAEWHVEALHRELLTRGFRAEVVQVPFQWTPRTEALRSCLSWRLLDLTHAGGVPID